MHNLLRFLKLNQFLLLFILIEGLSIGLLVQNNNYQANKIIKFCTQYTSPIYNYKNFLSNYFSLKEQNDYLITENAKLQTLLDKINNISILRLLSNKEFKYLAAK